MVIQYRHFSNPEEIKFYNTEHAYMKALPFTSLTQEQFDRMELARFEEYSKKEVSPGINLILEYTIPNLTATTPFMVSGVD